MSPPASVRTFEIFVSYSHKDARFVKPMMQMLRPTGASVFRDEDGIEPGTKWAAVIAEAIEGCRLVYLFWCSHSADSGEVKKEYEQALALKKGIVPLLLDDTPLPATLSEYQWIDLRPVIGAHEEKVEVKIPADKPKWRVERYSPGVDAYRGDDLAQEDADEGGDEFVGEVQRDKEIPADSLRRAAQLLSANIESHIAAAR